MSGSDNVTHPVQGLQAAQSSTAPERTPVPFFAITINSRAELEAAVALSIQWQEELQQEKREKQERRELRAHRRALRQQRLADWGGTAVFTEVSGSTAMPMGGAPLVVEISDSEPPPSDRSKVQASPHIPQSPSLEAECRRCQCTDEQPNEHNNWGTEPSEHYYVYTPPDTEEFLGSRCELEMHLRHFRHLRYCPYGASKDGLFTVRRLPFALRFPVFPDFCAAFSRRRGQQ